jgi:TolB-like protein/Tfp pilus assembly protein PilF
VEKMSLFAELKRRNVIKVAVAYIVTSWLVAQVAQLAAESFGAPDWVMKMFITLLALGFPFAIIFAWAFEMTPDGIKKEKDVDRSQSITRVTGQKLNHTIIGLLVLALGYFAYDKFIVSPGAIQPNPTAETEEAIDTGPRSIAVLPFVNMSEDSSNEYFSDGLTEELLNILAKIKELHVAGRTSSFAFKGKEDDLRIIGEKLNVNTILEGSVRKDDKRNRVRITAQLINVENGYHLWSETFDRELDDIFAIQEEIAREVAQALRVTLLGEDEARLGEIANTQMSAYDFYLQGLKSKNENSYDSLNLAVEKFQQAIALDPQYTPAQLGLIGTWYDLGITGAITRQQSTDNILPLLTMILQREPDNSNALTYRARIYSQQRDREAAEKTHMAALDANPRDVIALMATGTFLLGRERISEGAEFLQRAAAIDPYSSDVQWQLCFYLRFLVGQQDASLDACNRIREIEPASPNGYYGPAMNYELSGDLANAAYWYAESIAFDESDFELKSGLADQWINLGDLEMADQWLQRALELGADQPSPIGSKILLLQQREQHGQAAELARQAIDMESRGNSRNFIRNAYVIDALKRKDFQSALDAYRIDNPEIFEEPMRLREDNPSWNMDDLTEIAFILKTADVTSSQADKILDFVERKLQASDPALLPWLSELSLAALENARGNTAAAIAYLNSTFEQGMRSDWRLKLQHWFVLESLHNEPEYQQLIALFEADMERQREAAYELMGIAK